MSFYRLLSLLLTLIISNVYCLPEYSKIPIPEQVHIALGDTSDSIVVQWVTMQPVDKEIFVEYGKNRDKLDNKNLAKVDIFNYNNVTRYMYTAIMTKLDYNSTYYYHVGAESLLSRIFKFKTFPNGTDFSYTVCILGDLGVENGVSASYLLHAAERREFDLAIIVGDIAYDLHTYDGLMGDIFMRMMEPMIAQIPFLVIAGNHEDDGKNFSNYRYRFNMPNDPYQDNQFYSFDLGPIHWVGISTEHYGFFYEYGHEPVINQYNWLKEDLKNAHNNRKDIPWIVSYQHRPFYCSNTNSYECESFENTLVRIGFEEMPGLEKLFVDYEMDLGFWGHEHSYERFYPISRRFVYNLTDDPYHNAVAPTYVISGSAGCHSPHAIFNEDKPTPGSAARFIDYGYSMLHVYNKTHLFMEQISVESTPKIIDSFWLTKTRKHTASADKALKQLALSFPPYDQGSQCNVRDPRCKHRRNMRLRKKREASNKNINP